MYSDWYTFILLVGTTLCTVVGTAWSLAWWLSKQFSLVKNLVYTEMSQVQKTLTDKLEYHEQHDDQRFHDLRNDLWEIRVRNASQDSFIRLEEKKSH